MLRRVGIIVFKVKRVLADTRYTKSPHLINFRQMYLETSNVLTKSNDFITKRGCILWISKLPHPPFLKMGICGDESK